MSATPPSSGSTYNISMPARLPVPGNAEFLLWLVVEVVLIVVVWIADSVTVGTWIDVTKWLTAAYLLSRGIAKASRVLEQ